MPIEPGAIFMFPVAGNAEKINLTRQRDKV